MVKYYSEAPVEESMKRRVGDKGTSYVVQNIATILPLI